ncbi:MAG: hypothetical protein M1335_03890 [Chloroflexi bacterium]|nr:hypothetical protein [Chloroflexota bacterium]
MKDGEPLERKNIDGEAAQAYHSLSSGRLSDPDVVLAEKVLNPAGVRQVAHVDASTHVQQLHAYWLAPDIVVDATVGVQIDAECIRVIVESDISGVGFGIVLKTFHFLTGPSR